MTDSLLDRFLRYVRIDTQADETSATYPSTAKQLDLSRLLADECRAMGLGDVTLSEFGVVMATVPASPGVTAPAIAWIAHVDTSPEFSGTGVSPQVVRNYQGQDLTLPGDPSRVLRPTEFPELKTVVGHDLVTTDGTTLLGADDKAGIAAMMTAAAELMRSPKPPHAAVRLCFTCDEEIGRGADKLDLAKLNAVCGYTLDGGGTGEIDGETFSADQAIVTVTGVNTHPSIGKNSMVNAVRILSTFLARLPWQGISPETTDKRQGFIHPYHIEGGVASCTARIILRDFDTPKLTEYAQLLEQVAEPLRQEFPRATIRIEIRRQYRNFRDGLGKEPRAIPKAEAAMRAVGLEPKFSIIRGGTDGSLLTEKGLPTPNLSTGQHNPHSPLEWASVNEMETAARVLVALAREWAKP